MLDPSPLPAASSGPYPHRDLVARVHDGDSTAEQELVERFSKGLTLMLRQLTGDPALADDLCQDTLALVLTKARGGEIRNPDALPAFIRATARNLFIADRRKEKRYSELDPDDDPRAQSGAPQLRRLISDEQADLVQRLLGELRFARDRELLVRYYLGDDTKEELCRELDIDPGRFNRVLFRARRRLRELWLRSEKRQTYLSQAMIFFGTIIALATLKY